MLGRREGRSSNNPFRFLGFGNLISLNEQLELSLAVSHCNTHQIAGLHTHTHTPPLFKKDVRILVFTEYSKIHWDCQPKTGCAIRDGVVAHQENTGDSR